MNIKELEKLVSETNDLILLRKNECEIRIISIFIIDGMIRIEQYNIHKFDILINKDDIESLLSNVKLYSIFNEDDYASEYIEEQSFDWLFDGIDLTKVLKSKELNFNETIISFINNEMDVLLFKATF